MRRSKGRGKEISRGGWRPLKRRGMTSNGGSNRWKKRPKSELGKRKTMKGCSAILRPNAEAAESKGLQDKNLFESNPIELPNHTIRTASLRKMELDPQLIHHRLKMERIMRGPCGYDYELAGLGYISTKKVVRKIL